MTRPAAPQVPTPGQDSFLDIVANLVGILIILIMVIGAQATDAMVDLAPKKDNPPAVNLEAPKAEANAIEADVRSIGARIQREELEIEYRRKERDKIQLLVAAAEKATQKQRSQLDAAHRQQYDLQRDLNSARRKLQELEQSQQVVQSQMDQPAVIRHMPTPLAKTVFSTETHFRLLHGRIVYLPWDDLVDRLRNEAPHKVWKLKTLPRITETIGPVMGFRLQYTLKRTQYAVRTGAGVAVQQGVELDRFILIPVADNLGEPLDQALQEGSAFRQIIDGLDPKRATITVWVYPDSFDQFRRLKEILVGRGFVTAARPLPEGYPIGGSPRGVRSAAQ